MRLISFSFLALLLSIGLSQAATIFDLRDTLNTAAIEAGGVTQSGLTLMLTSAQGSLNQTSSSFGVNHTTTGGLEETDQIDGVHGAESINISFDQNLRITSLTLSNYASGGSETASFTIGSFSAINLAALAAASDVYNFSSDHLLNIGQTAQLAWLSGNGFSFDSITVETIPSIVPEPAPLALFSLALLCRVFVRKRC